jgi:ATP-dependent Clp protease ATP-binding subunit ClpC
MEDELNNEVIGQKEVVKKISESIKRSRVGINDPNKPTASFLFLGTTGVGKTFLAKKLSNILFDTDESFIRIDMSEYMESHAVSKLIGSPPGYVGFDNKGQLTEKVKNHPYSLILFDEIEKAHPDVLNILLQLLDDGTITDSTGKNINFKNCVIIMTSNIGTSKIIGEKRVGFESKMNNTYQKDVDSNVMSELKKKLKPELLNRIDEKVVFKVLMEDDIKKIVDLELNKVKKRILKIGYEVNFDDSLKNYIHKIGYSKEFGARPIKRAISTYVENFISQIILENKINKKEEVCLKYNDVDKKVYVG